jgi:DNA mismatch endonuclease, patch repair protein
MADIFSKEKRSDVMSKIRSKETKLEIEFRKKLWKAGFRYRKNASGYYGKPDVLLKKHKTVIFIDSCFWHGCKKHFKLPTTRMEFWKTKIEQNKKRDKEVNKYFRKKDWQVLRIWEHDLKSEEKILKMIDKIKK